MRVLTSLRAKLSLLILFPAIPAATAILFTLNSREALLAQHLGSQPGLGNALLGREIIAIAALGILTVTAIWLGSSLLVARGKLLSAAAPIAVDRGPVPTRSGTAAAIWTSCSPP